MKTTKPYQSPFPLNLRYSPVNWLIVNWAYNGTRFADCGLPEPAPCPPEREPSPTPCTPLRVQEAIDTYDWERWLPEVIVGIENPDEEIAANYVREAAINFAKRSRVLQRELLIALQPGVCTYPLEPYDGEEIIGVVGLALDDGKPCSCQSHCSGFMPNGVAFTLDPRRKELHLEAPHGGRCCDRPQTLRVLVWASPSEDACAQDVFLYDNYRETIAQSARYRYANAVHFRDRLLMASLQDEQGKFERAIARAKRDAMEPHSWAITQTGSGMWGPRKASRGMR